MQSIASVYEIEYGSNEKGAYFELGADLNLADETEIWKLLAEARQLPAPVVNEGLLDISENYANAADIRMFEDKSVEIDFNAEIEKDGKVEYLKVSNAQQFLSEEMVQEIAERFNEAMQESKYDVDEELRNAKAKSFESSEKNNFDKG